MVVPGKARHSNTGNKHGMTHEDIAEIAKKYENLLFYIDKVWDFIKDLYARPYCTVMGYEITNVYSDVIVITVAQNDVNGGVPFTDEVRISTGYIEALSRVFTNPAMVSHRDFALDCLKDIVVAYHTKLLKEKADAAAAVKHDDV